MKAVVVALAICWIVILIILLWIMDSLDLCKKMAFGNSERASAIEAKVEAMESSEGVGDCKEVDTLINRMAEKILNDIKQHKSWTTEDIDALARLIEARAKLRR